MKTLVCKSIMVKCLTIFQFFLCIYHADASDISQFKRLEVRLGKYIQLSKDYIYLDNADVPAAYHLQILDSPSGIYSFNNDEVKFIESGVQVVYVRLDDGNNQINGTLKINVLDNRVLKFANSDFDNAVRNFNITPWYFQSHLDGSLENESGNHFMRINTNSNNQVTIRTETTKYITAEREGKYRFFFKARTSNNQLGRIEQFLTYGSNRQYLEYVNVCTNLKTDSWTEYSMDFNTGFNGELGVGFRFDGVDVSYDIDDIRVEKYNQETGLYEVKDFTNRNFDAPLTTDEWQTWGAKNIDREIVEGFELKAAKLWLSGSNTSGRLRTGGTTYIPIKKGHKYTLTFYSKASGVNAELDFYLTHGSNNKYLVSNTHNYSKADEWEKISGEQVIADADGTLGVYFGPRTNGVEYYIDKVEVVEEAVPSVPSVYSEVYVSSGYGNDQSADGSINLPFKSVAAAINSRYWEAGDKCILLEGDYYEEVILDNLNGLAEDPIVICPMAGQDVRLTGITNIDGNWELAPGMNGAWRMAVGHSVQQLWLEKEGDMQMQTLARWPNISDNFSRDFNMDYTARDPEQGSCWDYDAVWTALDIQDKKNNTNVFEDYSIWYNGDNNRPIDKDYTGGVVVLKMGYEVVGERITDVDLTQQTLTSTSENFAETSIGGNKQYFFITAHKNCLDYQGEWYYSANEGYLYYMPADGIDNPNDFNFYAKTAEKFFSMNNCSAIEINGFNFFGTTLSSVGSSHLKVRNCTFDYPSYVKWGLSGASDAVRLSRDYSPTSFAPADVHVFNCEFRYFDGSALNLDGQEHVAPVVENCLFHNGRHDHVVRMTNCDGAMFRWNTLYASQRGNGLKYYKSPKGKLVAEYNYFHNLASHRSDASCVQIQSGSQKNDTVRFNWFHDTENKGIRCDGEPGGEYATHMNNVGWNLWQGLQIKGDDHTVVGNTFFDNGKRCDISVLADVEFGGNKGTRIFNNLAERMSGHRVRTVLEHPLPGHSGNNWNSFVTNEDATSVLRDPYNLDFRPKAGSALIDAGEKELPGLPLDLFFNDQVPDIGAYQLNEDNYIIPGRKADKASRPVPPHNSVTAFSDCDLMWREALGTRTHLVYFGTNPNNLALIGEQVNNIYDPGSLNKETVYFWRIDEKLTDGTIVTGDTWLFVPAGEENLQNQLPTSYEELFDYNADDSEGDPWNDILWVKDHVVADKVELVDDELVIDPALNDGNGDFIAIEDLNMLLRPAPLMQFDYKSSLANQDLKVCVRAMSNGGVVGEWVEFDVPVSATDAFTNTVLNIAEVFTKWDEAHGAESYTHLEELDIRISFNEEAANSSKAKITIENFRLGFICLKDYEKELVITGQSEKTATVGTPFYLGLPHVTISVRIPEFDEGVNVFEVVNLKELSGTPRLEVLPGVDYSQNVNIATFNVAKSQWEVPIIVSAGALQTEVYQFEISNVPTSLMPIQESSVLKISPNPAHDFICLERNSETEYQYEIFDMSGRLLILGHQNANRIDLSRLPAGHYLLKVKGGAIEKGVARFIKR